MTTPDPLHGLQHNPAALPAAPSVATAAGPSSSEHGQRLLPLILQAWREVLNLPAAQLQTNSNFFLSGGDSLLLMQVLVRIRQALQVDLRLQDAAHFSTPLDMARWCITVGGSAVLAAALRREQGFEALATAGTGTTARGSKGQGSIGEGSTGEGSTGEGSTGEGSTGRELEEHEPREQAFQEQAFEEQAFEEQGIGEQNPWFTAVPAIAEYPASANQQGIWLADLQCDGRAIYNTAVVLQLQGRLDAAVLAQALTTVLQRHPALRSNLRFDTDTRQLHVHTRDLDAVMLNSENASEQQAYARMQELAAQPFDLANAALWRFHLFTLSVHRHWLCICVHHCVTDGWSGAVLLRSLGEAYNALLLDPHWQPPCIDTAHIAYAVEQQRMLADTRSPPWQTLDTWRRRLAGADSTRGVFDAKGHAWPYKLKHLDVVLPPRLLRALATSAEKLGVTLFTLLLTAFRLSLHALTGVRDQCIGIPVAGRDSPQREQGVGCYLNLLVARSSIVAGETWHAMAQRLHAETLQDLDNLQLPFSTLLAQLQPALQPGGHACFDVLFAFQNYPRAAVEFIGLQHQRARVPLPYGHYVLEVDVSVNQQGCMCHLAYAAAVVGSAAALQLAEQMVQQLWRFSSA